MSDKMIKTKFYKLEVGDEYWYTDHSNTWPHNFMRKKTGSHSHTYVTTGGDMAESPNETVFIKEPKMDKKQEAIKAIEAAEKKAAEAVAEIKVAKAILAEEEVTYSIGDRFYWSDNKKWKRMLVGSGDKVNMVDLTTGREQQDSMRVGYNEKMKASELPWLGSYTRYWDARKRCKC